MNVSANPGGVNTPPNVLPFRGGKVKEGEHVTEDPIVLSDGSPEMRYGEMLASLGDYAVGGKLESGELDTTLYRWNGDYWDVQQPKLMAAHAFRWLKTERADKANKSLATACVDTAVLELIGREGCTLPDSRHRAIIPVQGAYLEIDKQGVVRVLSPDPSLGITYQVPAAFDLGLVNEDGTYTPRPVDPKSKWGQYLDRFQPDLAVRKVLQEATASSLLPMCLEKGIFLLGSGSNGKSTFLHILRTLHPRHSAVRMSKLDGQFAGQALVNKTALFASEAPKVISTDVQDVLKSIISRDPFQVEFKGRDAYTILPRATLFVALNEWFSVSGHEHGFWRKILTIPFNVCMEEGNKERVTDFHLQIINDPTEMGQVLNWILEGAVELIKRGGFGEMPEAITALAAKNRRSSDSVAAYLEDREAVHCELVNTSKTAIYQDYREYTLLEAGKKPVGDEEFWKRVRDRFPGLILRHLSVPGRMKRVRVRTASLLLANIDPVSDDRALDTPPEQCLAGIDDVPA